MAKARIPYSTRAILLRCGVCRLIAICEANGAFSGQMVFFGLVWLQLVCDQSVTKAPPPPGRRRALALFPSLIAAISHGFAHPIGHIDSIAVPTAP